jgi:hypothetical protein
MKLLKHANFAPHDPELREYTVDAEKWAREVAAAEAAQQRFKRRKVATANNE